MWMQVIIRDEEPVVCGALAACWLLKFFECSLVRAQEYLLQFLISIWSPELQCFIVRGEHLAFSAEEDVYFLTRLHFQGTLLPTEPVIVGEG
jgi:hypothetical protein